MLNVTSDAPADLVIGLATMMSPASAPELPVVISMLVPELRKPLMNATFTLEPLAEGIHA